MVNLAFDSLALPSALDKFPIGRLVGFIGNTLRSLVRLTVVTAIERVRVVYRQLSRLQLANFSFLVLIYLDLFFDIFESLCIHLCRVGVASHQVSELHLLAFLG